jgi:hypothetical protein
MLPYKAKKTLAICERIARVFFLLGIYQKQDFAAQKTRRETNDAKE